MTISPIEQRYKTEMNPLFDEKSRLDSWMRVELALARAHAKLENIPEDAPADIEQAMGQVELERVEEIEAEIHHDLMAMVRALSEKCKEHGGYVHLGATSYDIEDTALGLTLRDAGGLLRTRLVQSKEVLARLAKVHAKHTCVGRTHGQHAVPTTYGLKFAHHYDSINRNLKRLDDAISQASVGKMSGAVGTMATFGADAFKIEEYVMEDLGLKPAKITTQVVSRDRLAQVIFTLALISSTLEQIAKDIRNLSRNEILEIAEPLAKKQVGSSTMPQKRNPHKSERICSLARLVRSHVSIALENIALEHERDLTNSANERFIISQSFIITDYMAKQMLSILQDLEFFDENIEKNLELTNGAILAERVMIALSKKGMGRQNAHELMRVSAREAFAQKKHLKEILKTKKEVSDLLRVDELDSLFDPHGYIGQADELIKRVVGQD